MSTVLTALSYAAPTFALILGWQQRFTLLWFYAMAGLSFDLFGLFLKTNGYNHHISNDVFILVQLLVISFYYRDKVFPSNRLFIVLTLFLASGFIAHTLSRPFDSLNFLGASILCTVYIGYGVTGYIKTLRNPKVIYLSESPFFWFNSAFFLYSASVCLLFLFLTYLKSTDFELMMKIWNNFFTVMNITHYIFIGIGLYKTKKVGT